MKDNWAKESTIKTAVENISRNKLASLMVFLHLTSSTTTQIAGISDIEPTNPENSFTQMVSNETKKPEIEKFIKEGLEAKTKGDGDLHGLVAKKVAHIDNNTNEEIDKNDLTNQVATALEALVDIITENNEKGDSKKPTRIAARNSRRDQDDKISSVADAASNFASGPGDMSIG